jgi:hypothetical protein
MNNSKKIAIISLVVLAFVLVPAMTVAAYSSAGTSSSTLAAACGNPKTETYPSLHGGSNYLGMKETFTANNVVFSGGKSGTFSAFSGSIKVGVLGASFKNLTGTYTIHGTEIEVQMSVGKLSVAGAVINNVRSPEFQVPCFTSFSS